MRRIPLYLVQEALRVAAARAKADVALRQALALAKTDEMRAAILAVSGAAEWSGVVRMTFHHRAIGSAA